MEIYKYNKYKIKYLNLKNKIKGGDVKNYIFDISNKSLNLPNPTYTSIDNAKKFIEQFIKIEEKNEKMNKEYNKIKLNIKEAVDSIKKFDNYIQITLTSTHLYEKLNDNFKKFVENNNIDNVSEKKMEKDKNYILLQIIVERLNY